MGEEVAAAAAAAVAEAKQRLAHDPPQGTSMNMTVIGDQRRRLLCILSLALLAAGPVAAQQRAFATPQEAAAALGAALKANDEQALLEIFGQQHKGVVSSGEPARDKEARAKVGAAMSSFLAIDASTDERRILLIGVNAWPFPVPLVREGSGWRFATELATDELLNRRIGENEREALRVMYAYLDAQRQYASGDRIGDGVRQYARRINSSAGKKDGLYWPADEAKGEETSPFGPLVAEAGPERRQGDPYYGYQFRVLTAQGPHAAGGAYNYVINGRLVAGFALVGYPREYGSSGVMTFIVNHNGTVFQKNLGPETKLAAKMTSFDPGKGWTAVKP